MQFSLIHRFAFDLVRVTLAALLWLVSGLQHRILPLIHAVRPFRQAEIASRRAARRAVMDADAGWTILQEVQRLADTAEAEVFAISGTLLGIHRHGRLLAHDVDIDVGIHAADPRLEDFLAAMRMSPWTRRMKTVRLGRVTRYLNPHIPPLPGNAIYHTFYMADPAGADQEVSVDVFVHFRALGFDVHGIDIRLWLNRPITCERVLVGDVNLCLPDDRVSYLRENYGDFTVERQVFENAVDCPNAVNLYSPAAAVWMVSKLNLYYRAAWHDRYDRLRVRCKDMIRGLLNARRQPPIWRIGEE